MEAEIGSELFKFIRNVLVHFPFFRSWDEVWITKNLVNWYREGQSIDKFLNVYVGRPPVKYRFWEATKKRMTYLSITLPNQYGGDTKIYLRDLVNERDGVRFCFVLMRQIMSTQIVNGYNERALQIVENSKSQEVATDFQAGEWKCDNCNETNEGQFLECWQCGTLRKKSL